MKEYVCALCHNTFNQQKIHQHIVKDHDIDFNLYLKEYHFGKKISCLNCGKDVKISIRGYTKYCSNHCQLLHRYKNETEEQKKLRISKLKSSWSNEAKIRQSKCKTDFFKNKHKTDPDYFTRVNEKVKQTKSKRYNDKNFNNMKQYEQTC